MRLLIAIAIVLLIYTIQSYYYRKHWRQDLHASLSFSTQLANIGESLTIYEVIENRKALPLPILHVKFRTDRSFCFADNENAQTTDYYYRNDVFSILGNQRITRTLTCKAMHRGYFTIDSLHLTSRDLFLTRTFACAISNQASLYVLPAILKQTELDAYQEQLLGDASDRQQGSEDPYNFCGIRAYQSFDSMRHINWKATAHTGTLMVNQFQPAGADHICLLLNVTPYQTSGADALLEHAICIANSLGQSFMEQAIPVSLYTNGCDTVTGAPSGLCSGAGTEHQLALSKLLARLDPKQTSSDFCALLQAQTAEDAPDTRYIMISTYRDDTLYNLFKDICSHIRLHWIIPEYSTTDIAYRDTDIIKWSLL